MTDPQVADPILVEPVRAWRVYGIVPADAELPDFDAGEDDGDLDSRELQVLRHGPIAAVVEEVDPNRPARRADLLAHSAVLNALAAHGPVIPVAFGSAFPEQDQVISGLLAPSDSAATLGDELERLRGHAQFQLRVRYQMDDLLAMIVTSNPAIAELRQRIQRRSEAQSYEDRMLLGERVSREVEARQAADADNLLTRLGRLAADARISRSEATVPLVSLAFLVADSERAEFEAEAERAAESMSDRAVLELLGPLAAFDFVADLAPQR